MQAQMDATMYFIGNNQRYMIARQEFDFRLRVNMQLHIYVKSASVDKVWVFTV